MHKLEVRIGDKIVGYIRPIGEVWVAVIYGDRYLPPKYGRKDHLLEYVRRHANMA